MDRVQNETPVAAAIMQTNTSRVVDSRGCPLYGLAGGDTLGGLHA